MELDIHTKQQLANLLEKPALVTQVHATLLADLVKAYPYYQPLHLLLAKANINSSESKNSLATAALYNDGNLLHRTIYQPETLVNIDFKSISTLVDQTPITGEQLDTIDEDEIFEEIVELSAIQKAKATDDQEVFDEIAELDPTSFTLVQEEINAPLPDLLTANPEEAVPDELAIENIVTTDFFAFEKSFATDQQAEISKQTVETVAQPEEYNLAAEAQTVSKYDDDKLPYTFLWWLAKTRKEHEQIFQPYVTAKKTDDNSTGELQQQYVEHIFHIQTPFNVADEANKTTLNRQLAPKGFEIIESFIKNDPQIKAPNAEQINNENKAKKSAEDNYDLVSETLAAIYIEQMLYHKAIDTYEKLSLKFPEKSRYFADLIQSLEKKI